MTVTSGFRHDCSVQVTQVWTRIGEQSTRYISDNFVSIEQSLVLHIAEINILAGGVDLRAASQLSRGLLLGRLKYS